MENQTREGLSVVGMGVLATQAMPFYLAPSESDPTRYYAVVQHMVENRATHLSCACKDYVYRGHDCKHILAVEEYKRWIVYREETERKAARAKRAELRRRALDEKVPVAASGSGEDVVSHAPPASREAHRASCSHPGDTAIPRRSNKPFSLLK
ncbi:MAG TPA: SWIM zinc finger family protein [Ktedonobacterales bacterium]|jgi:hypothetical protein